jgi:uncharacterized membrane protein YesL
MFKKLNELSFIIGLFFTIVSLILILNFLLNKQLSGRLNFYTGIVFLVFGLFMISIKTGKTAD